MTNHTCTNCGWRKGTLCTNPDREEWGKESKRAAGEECQLWENRRVCAECMFWDAPQGRSWKDYTGDKETLRKCAYNSHYRAGAHPACKDALWRQP